jgi:hypothetical protein
MSHSIEKSLLEHLLITMPTMFGVAYFVLWACAPPSTFPPPVPPMASPTDNPAGSKVSNEFGVGASVGGGKFTDVDFLTGQEITRRGTESGGQAWSNVRIDLEDVAVDLGAVFTLRSPLVPNSGRGSNEGAALGGYARLMAKVPRSQFGLELSGGILWARLAMPILFKVHPRLWVYTSPSLTASTFSEVQVPLGVAINLNQWSALYLEGIYINEGVDSLPAQLITGAASLIVRPALFWRSKSPPPTRELPRTKPAPLPDTAPSSTSAPASIPGFVPASVPTVITPASAPAIEP